MVENGVTEESLEIINKGTDAILEIIPLGTDNA